MRGYEGGIAILRRHVAEVRPIPRGEVYLRTERLIGERKVSCSRLHFEMAVTVGFGGGVTGKDRPGECRKGIWIGFEIGAPATHGQTRSRGSKVSGMPRLRVVPSRSEGGHPG